MDCLCKGTTWAVLHAEVLCACPFCDMRACCFTPDAWQFFVASTLNFAGRFRQRQGAAEWVKLNHAACYCEVKAFRVAATVHFFSTQWLASCLPAAYTGAMVIIFIMLPIQAIHQCVCLGAVAPCSSTAVRALPG